MIKNKRTRYVSNKYGNKKTVIDGIKFDSKLEAKRYSELKLMQKAGVIKDLELQPKFLLQEGFRDADGKKHQAINYIADFKYIQDGETIIEDTKGRETDVYRIKKKMLLYKYPDINFFEVRK